MIENMKTAMDLEFDELEKRLEEKVTRRIEKRLEGKLYKMILRVIHSKLGPFFDVGAEILMSELEDMAIDKTQRYTKSKEDNDYSAQVDVFITSYHSILSLAETTLTPMLPPKPDPQGSSRGQTSQLPQTTIEKFLDYLKEGGEEVYMVICERLIEFVYGRDGIWRRS
jgi:hypothetical protein